MDAQELFGMDGPDRPENDEANNNNNNNGDAPNDRANPNEEERNLDDDDDDEDDDEEDDEDDDDDDDDNENEDNDAIEGGCASGEDRNAPSHVCNMHLYLELTEDLPSHMAPENHPIYAKGTKVVIGLEKTTRLSAVFARYCEFANAYEIKQEDKEKEKEESQSKPTIDHTDLEFLHCSILSPTDTAETSALMKNDVIRVRKARLKERRMKADFLKDQKASDKIYFEQMRKLIPDALGGARHFEQEMERVAERANRRRSAEAPQGVEDDENADEDNEEKSTGRIDDGLPLQSQSNVVVFHCKGRIRDEAGYRQDVLSSSVRGHSRILSRRCEWLKDKIKIAQREMESKNIGQQGRDDQRRLGSGRDSLADEDIMFDAQQLQNQAQRRRDNVAIGNAVPVDDDGDEDLDLSINNNNMNQFRRGGANAVEIDEDDDNHMNRRQAIIQDFNEDDMIRIDEPSSQVAPSPFTCPRQKSAIHITLDHSPEAVKLLLEYCYTNRVIALGQKAFNKSYKPIDPNSVDPFLIEYSGPVSPFASSRPKVWSPEDVSTRKPTINLSVALAGVRLAEEAKLPRLSLMCEIAASELVTDATALEALVACQQQYRMSGNRLVYLRKAVMKYHVFGSGPKGIEELSNMNSFQRILTEKSYDIIPSLMMGVMEIMKELNGEKDKPDEDDSKRKDRKARSETRLKKIDETDIVARNKERLKRRSERWDLRSEEEKNPYKLEDIKQNPFSSQINRLEDLFQDNDVALHNEFGKSRKRRSRGSSYDKMHFNSGRRSNSRKRRK